MKKLESSSIEKLPEQKKFITSYLENLKSIYLSLWNTSKADREQSLELQLSKTNCYGCHISMDLSNRQREKPYEIQCPGSMPRMNTKWLNLVD